MRRAVIEKGLRDLREGNPSVFWAFVTRDGVVLSHDLPEGVHQETFAIMCATLLGAAHTLNSEFPEGEVERIIVEAGRYRVLVTGLDQDSLMALVVPRNMDIGALLVYLQKIRKQAEHED
jgi:predicted regulator of Ras-like GTPase activity (Roadblock/LC7/MglB family)